MKGRVSGRQVLDGQSVDAQIARPVPVGSYPRPSLARRPRGHLATRPSPDDPPGEKQRERPQHNLERDRTSASPGSSRLRYLLRAEKGKMVTALCAGSA